jgi:hypothetical protein
MDRTYVIPGSVVSKKNSKIATTVGGVNVKARAIILPSNAYKKWEKTARIWVLTKYGAEIIITHAIHVEAHFYYRGKQPDLSGAMESIADCMEGLLWENDGLIQSWDGSRLHHDRDNPRTVITVTDL